jgi:hypothetical protein
MALHACIQNELFLSDVVSSIYPFYPYPCFSYLWGRKGTEERRAKGEKLPGLLLFIAFWPSDADGDPLHSLISHFIARVRVLK